MRCYRELSPDGQTDCFENLGQVIRATRAIRGKIYSAGVSILPDKDHVVKLGPSDLLRWENIIYGIVQEGGLTPKVCESFADLDEDGYLVLHRVHCLSDMFWLLDIEPHLGTFDDENTAWFAYSALQALHGIHNRGVLHCDIHPGNIGITASTPASRMFAQMPPFGPFRTEDHSRWHVTFIDYQWSRHYDYHPRGTDIPPTCMWSYASDRQLYAYGSPEYSAVDDFESLAYTLLALCYLGQLPWSDNIERERSRNPFFGGSKSDMEFIIQTRKRYLDDLHHCGSALDTLPFKAQVTLVDLIMYARGLKPDEKIDYLRWEKVFATVVCKEA